MCMLYFRTKIAAGRNAQTKGVLPNDDDIKNAVRYDRVMIFGIDGAGDYFSKCDVPNFDRVFGSGAKTFTARSQWPTISAENWTAVLHAVPFQLHKTTNQIAASHSFTNVKYPSVFKVYAERHPDAVTASVVNWYPINKGIVEDDIPGNYKINAGEHYKGPNDDEAVDRTAVDLILDFIKDNDPKILYTHLDGPDHGGHSCGYGTEGYIQSVKNVDVLIGKIYDAYCEKGWKDNTLFILITDHGHVNRNGHGGHGGWTESERNVTLAVAGGLGNIKNGAIGPAGTVDVSSIALYGLGEKQPDSWTGRVPEGIFTTLK